MAYNHEWPYSDPGRANTDWEINEIKRLKSIVELKFDEILRKFIMDKFNSLFAGLVYVEETSTLKMYLGVVADGEHIYTAGNETMKIM